MTISTELRKAGPFTGNGVATAFPFSFKVFAATDVTVTVANTQGNESALALGADYAVALNADQDAAPGGTVTLAAPLASGHRLVVSSAVPNLQPTDITNNGGFYPRVIEDALDRHVAQIQQIDEKVDRALKVAVTSPLGDQALPSPVAGMLIGWNESNDGLTNYAPIGGTLLGQQLAAANGSSLVGFQQAGTGAVVRTAQDKMREWVSVKDFGAVGDGVADDTAAIQSAVDHIHALGSGVITFPAGTYMVNASGNLTGIQMKSGVYLNLTGAKLKAIGVNSPNYRLVYFTGVSDCGVIGGEIEGDRAANSASGEQGHGIYIILNCSRILIENVTVSSCFGDGIYIGRLCSDIKVMGCTITNNRRNNISVVSASNVIIDGCDISNANGALPEIGIDVEPNPGDAVSYNVVITNCHIYGNNKEGIAFPAPPPTPLIETAVISNCHIYNNGSQGIRASYVKHLEVTGCIIYGNAGGGIYDTAALATSLNIDGNLIFGNTGSGVEGFASGTIIANNKIANNTQWGVKWQFGQHVTIAGNVISDHGEDGIFYERAYNSAIVGNTVKNSQKHGIFITGTSTSSVTRSRKVTIGGNTVSFSGLLADNTYSGIYLDANANTSVVTGNTVVAGTSGNLPLHAIYAVDATVYVANNQTDSGAKSGNPQVNVGGISMPSFLNSPNIFSHTYAPHYYLPGLCFITAGTNTPEGALSAPVGSLFLRTNGGANTTLYVKESGAGNTGWVAK